MRDNSQRLLSNKAFIANVVVKVSGTQAYSQTISGMTNMHGLLDLNFGDSTFTTLDWAHATISMEVKYATTNEVYVPAEDRPVNAVPYTLNAANIPVQVNADWDATSGVAEILNKPAIPDTANNAKLTIQKNGTTVGVFTANASVDSTINITVPTQTSDLTNNSYFVDNSNCQTVSFCELDSMVRALQSTVAGMQHAVATQNSLMAAQDSILNAMDNQLNTFVCGTSTVTDHQGNVYNTVQIGSQCWTMENMRCTTSPSTGTTILEDPATSYSFSGKKAYYVNGDASKTAAYGLLYNWCAAVDTFNTAKGSETNTSAILSDAPSVTFTGHRRGICPEGWHVPSNAECTSLTDYVSAHSEYVCNEMNTYIAKALASTEGWNSSTTNCAVGNTPSSNNATSFSAVPAGYYDGSYNGFGNIVYLWSATESSSTSAYYRGLNCYYAGVNRSRYYK